MPTVSVLLVALFGLSSAAPSRLRVEIVFEGVPMRPKTEAMAMSEVTAIWAPYGVDIHEVSDRDAASTGAVRLSVVLANHHIRTIPASALGSAWFVGNSPQPTIFMYPQAVAELLSTVTVFGRHEEQWARNFRDQMLGRMLGRALAHEVGHVLLRSRDHSSNGLMRARHSVTDLVALDHNGFHLSTDEVMRLAWTTSPSHHLATP
jgi:hypothetical protein